MLLALLMTFPNTKIWKCHFFVVSLQSKSSKMSVAVRSFWNFRQTSPLRDKLLTFNGRSLDTRLTSNSPPRAYQNSIDAKSRFYRHQMQSEGGDFRVISVSFLCD